MGRRAEPWNPNTAAWLVRMRGARTQDQVVADMAARGVAVKRAWLSRIENGAPFSDELLDAFRDYYGSEPPAYEPTTTEPPSELADLVTEIRGQTAALNRLADALEAQPGTSELAVILHGLIDVQADQSRHVEANSDRILTLEKALGARFEQALAEARGRPARRETGG